MNKYLIRRLFQLVPVLLLISMIVFIVIHIAPGDPIYTMYSNPNKRDLSPVQMEQLRHKLGLDRPIYIQYAIWLKNVVMGDWGYSLRTKAPVLQELAVRLPNTILLGVASILLTLVIAIPTGAFSAVKRYSIVDYLVTFIVFFGISVPRFWFALVLIQLFSYRLGWLPSVGMSSIGGTISIDSPVLDLLKHMIMPVLSISLLEIAYWSRYQRSSLLEVLNQDYVRTARAKGASERRVLFRHAFRNSLIPIITLAGLALPDIFAGSYIIETIFGWPGIGRFGVLAIMERDYPVVMGVTMITSLIVVVGNLLADVLYAIADPRIHQE